MPFRTLVAVAAAFALTGVLLAVDPPRALPPVTTGKDTTVVTGPFDKDGTIDYETALNERMRGKSTSDTNAVVLLLKAIGPKPEGSLLHADYYKWLGVKELPEKGDYVFRHHLFFEEETRGDDPQAFWDRLGELRTRPWTAKEEPFIAEWLAVNEKPLALIAEAVKRPDYFHPLVARTTAGKRGPLIGALTVQRPDYKSFLSAHDDDRWLVGTLLPLMQRCREIAAILSVRVMLRCGEKDYAAAWQDVMTMHRLARLVGKGATVNELLVGFAIDAFARASALRLLAVAEPTAKQALAWRDELASLPPFPSPAEKVAVGERFAFLDVCQFVRRDGADILNSILASEHLDEARDFLAASGRKLDWDKVLRSGNGWYDRLADALRKPTLPERTAALQDIDAELKDLCREHGATDLAGRLALTAIPAVRMACERSARREFERPPELLAFALAAYRADKKSYPAKLADLVPKYAAAIPGDPYSGGDITYRVRTNGYSLYSVGLNGRDDNAHHDGGGFKNDDFGLRMYREK